MRTAAIPFHLDKVSSPATETRTLAFGFAASAVPAGSNFVQVPPPLTAQQVYCFIRETAVTVGLFLLCPHARSTQRVAGYFCGIRLPPVRFIRSHNIPKRKEQPLCASRYLCILY